MRGFSLVVVSGGYSSLWCAGFSLSWLLLLQSTGSRHEGFSSCGSRALEHRIRSCDVQALLLHSLWDLPGPGLEPVSPALAGGFLTTALLGKPLLPHSCLQPNISLHVCTIINLIRPLLINVDCFQSFALISKPLFILFHLWHLKHFAL